MDTATSDDARVARLKRIGRTISKEIGIPHQKALDGLARMAGMTHWGALAASSPSPTAAHDILAPDARSRTPLFGDDMEPGRIDALRPVREAVDRGLGLMVVGATSTGKTTLLSRLVTETRPKAALALVDADEIATSRPGARTNWSIHSIRRWPRGMLETGRTEYLADATSQALGDAFAEEPDAIVLGEMSTWTAMRVLSSSVRVLTTIHARDVNEAVERCAELALHGSAKRDGEDWLDACRDAARRRFCFVQVLRDAGTGRRSIGEVRVPDDGRGDGR